jgi:hypothetical protein
LCAAATIGQGLPMEVLAAAHRDNLTLNHQGARHDRLSAHQQVSLLHLMFMSGAFDAGTLRCDWSQ